MKKILFTCLIMTSLSASSQTPKDSIEISRPWGKVTPGKYEVKRDTVDGYLTKRYIVFNGEKRYIQRREEKIKL